MRLLSSLISIISLALAMPAIAGQLEDEANALIDTALSSDLAFDLVESLTTEIGPRLAGSPAEERARAWAVKKLKGLGYDKVYVEPFTMPYWERGHISIEVGAPFSQPLYGIALGDSVSTPIGGIKASIVYFENYAKLAAAEENSLTGKLVFIDGTMIKTQDGSGYSMAGPRRWSGPAMASSKGAIGALVRSVGTDQTRSAHTGVTVTMDGVSAIPSAALSNPDADQLARLLKLQPELQIHYTQSSRFTGDVQSGNVIAEITGKKYPDEIVVLAAHLDSWDNSPGAVDDGAGVAIVSAAGKLIADLGRPDRTIRIILFGAEEPGLYGAEAYVKAHKEDMNQIIMVTESDFGAGRIWRMDTGIAKSDLPKAKRIQKVLARLDVGPGRETASGGSDVSKLSGAGAPAISLIQDGWDYFDLHHTANDTLDKVDPENLRQNVAVYAAYGWMVANTEGGFHAPEKKKE